MTVYFKIVVDLYPDDSLTIMKFNFKTFLIATIFCCALTFVTLVATAARDEGTGGHGVLVKTFEKLFYIFRFPTHALLFRFMNGSVFFVGLLINCIFYGFVVERAFSFYKSRNLKV
ncbi:hypothetical protein Solca_3614 [Solitalea canadensis DSM 3403]|uniref:Uncharacterized protein n=1 Tax=Solitalea canadensis (strain ATCC 29591 / DSM 3403 / JCM 21819 / LMG 8368 / NBRC 15130 / NCIMB 12057 / USAM 9D) TaxID=929556 RepID=H8KLB6_SOLCM|nr:hypothetical protein Solca_3614 [Solitalea canadensis DSM 3403]